MRLAQLIDIKSDSLGEGQPLGQGGRGGEE